VVEVEAWVGGGGWDETGDFVKRKAARLWAVVRVSDSGQGFGGGPPTNACQSDAPGVRRDQSTSSIRARGEGSERRG
jgi:hypothetical protein